jgi:hypothetical protein
VFSLQFVYVKRNVVGDRVSRGKIFIFNHHSAVRTIELNESAEIWIWTETVSLPFDQGRVYLLECSLGDETPLLIAVSGACERFSTPLAAPPLVF